MSHVVEINDEQLEIQLFLEAIYRKYGYDFREYSVAHTRRRLEYRRAAEGMKNYSEMLHKVIYDPRFFEQILLDLSINVTEMFRDPWFYKKVREIVLPHLKTYPFVKVWHAGCSAGQEVYSMGILLEEEGMNERAQLYATDFNEAILEKAQKGIYPMDLVRQYTTNYQASGGLNSFSDYYTADYEHVIIKNRLRDNVLFTPHNLATDGVFGEMNVIFCRNVLIYFNRELQNKVFQLFYDSLVPGGFLCLGSKESLRFSGIAEKFELVSEREKIYRKKREPVIG
ncbi:protein-glutamate O-methyltransferase CheR [Vibrio sp. CAU 1672]|uniref:CheR family methyltransferase n=1 Tax=Vibrio sp. CAU 1672 TaxID=3032594 RepID=UPI0023DA5D33|nr:protein-glutamate O-methyltransferase CheR [Vibrio sp. CAU 1672]MDF2154537.1 protein-glutamate O-methyltransferase CheR [Vibrio sp. CAU 1672]